MKFIKTAAVLLALTFASSSAFAEKEARESRLDSRIKTLEFNEGQVYVVNTHYLQTSMIMFHKDENIIHIGAGDPLAWTLTPVDNYLEVKPKLKDADTNLNVLTQNLVTNEVRAYIFELNALEAKSLKDDKSTFFLQFTYPQEELKKKLAAMKRERVIEDTEVVVNRKTAATDWNLEYSYAGNTTLVPVRTFDDGEFTYFQFPSKIDTPAIFLVDDDKGESLLNYHVSGKYVVVQRLGKQFILRDGEKATCIFNDNFDGRGEDTVMKLASVATEKKPQRNGPTGK